MAGLAAQATRATDHQPAHYVRDQQGLGDGRIVACAEAIREIGQLLAVVGEAQSGIGAQVKPKFPDSTGETLDLTH